jgi:hypothetical protein
MTPFTVYLVVRNTPDNHKSHAMDRRLRALRALHDELTTIGVRVTPLPEYADLEVEITNVFVAGESHLPGRADTTTPAERGRIMSIRLSVSDEHAELVCSDGMGRVPAERYAAQRIMMWLDGLSCPRMTDLVHAPTA